jgi:hypothetical protein
VKFKSSEKAKKGGIMTNMKRLFIAAMVIGLTFTAITAFAQTAKEAIFGLKKLQARCQAGISYSDYSNAVADAKFPVNLFIESPEAQKYPELTASINIAMQHYEYAGTLWNIKLSDRFAALVRCDSEVAKSISQRYPQAKRDAALREGYCYFIDSVLGVIWEEASNELKNTTNLYTKTEGDTSNSVDKLKKENEQLKAENANLKKQLGLMKSKKKK